MKINREGDIEKESFCCSSFYEHTKRPDMMIVVAPWKQYQNSIEKWRAQMFVLPSGISSTVTGEQGVAGCGMIPINYCPFCSKPVRITIENT